MISNDNIFTHLRRNFAALKTINPLHYLKFACGSCCCLFRSARRSVSYQFGQLLKKADSSVNKELDLKKFLVRQRIQSTSLLGLLSGRQTYFVDKMS